MLAAVDVLGRPTRLDSPPPPPSPYQSVPLVCGLLLCVPLCCAVRHRRSLTPPPSAPRTSPSSSPSLPSLPIPTFIMSWQSVRCGRRGGGGAGWSTRSLFFFFFVPPVVAWSFVGREPMWEVVRVTARSSPPAFLPSDDAPAGAGDALGCCFGGRTACGRVIPAVGRGVRAALVIPHGRGGWGDGPLHSHPCAGDPGAGTKGGVRRGT